MQSARKNNYRKLQIIAILIILLHIILNIIADNRLITLLTSSLLLATFVFLCRFWINLIIPAENPIREFSQLPSFLLDLLTGKDSILVIKEGRCQQDYFLLKKAPKIRSLFIQQDSAVLIQNSNDELKLLTPGFNAIQQDEKAILTFNLNLQQLTYGPREGEYPFNRKKSGESYTDFHARQLRAEKVRSLTQNGIILYPSFKIYYQLFRASEQDRDDQWFCIQQVGKFLHDKNIRGESLASINEQLGSDIIACWIEQVSQLTLADIHSSSSTQNLIGIMNHINRRFSNLHSSDPNKKSNGKGIKDKILSSADWNLPFIKIHLQELAIQKTGQVKNE